MARKTHSSNVGKGAITIYALLAALTGVALFELGAAPLGYAPLTSLLAAKPAQEPLSDQRYGKMWIRADGRHCRAFSLDNETQAIIPSGTVACNTDSGTSYDQRSRTEIIRDAFRGQ